MALIECRNIHRDYSGTVVLESIDFSIDPSEKVGLVGRDDESVSALSGGERGSLTSALRGNPELLVLDEPGNQLDFLIVLQRM
jgi:ATPase subunit of ABC transporter with duplicated ATPase domains